MERPPPSLRGLIDPRGNQYRSRRRSRVGRVIYPAGRYAPGSFGDFRFTRGATETRFPVPSVASYGRSFPPPHSPPPFPHPSIVPPTAAFTPQVFKTRRAGVRLPSRGLFITRSYKQLEAVPIVTVASIIPDKDSIAETRGGDGGGGNHLAARF